LLIPLQKASPLYTEDPSQACLFILSLDTLSRDILDNGVGDFSKSVYLPNLQSLLKEMGTKWGLWGLSLNQPQWNEGANHVVFNLFSGTLLLHPHFD